MVTVNGEKVSHGHAFQSNQDPNKWYFTARLDGQQLRPQLMKPEDVAAYQKREIGVEALMQTYYPTKLAKKVTPEEYKADNKLSDGRVIEKMVVYKEHDEQRQDVGKYKLYTQVGEQKMSRTMSKEDLNAYFDRVTTPSKLVEKNFGEQLHLASFYNQFKLEEGVKEVRIAKNYDGDWTVSASSLTTGRQARPCSHGTTSRRSSRKDGYQGATGCTLSQHGNQGDAKGEGQCKAGVQPIKSL
jgi:hypothetical protein